MKIQTAVTTPRSFNTVKVENPAPQQQPAENPAPAQQQEVKDQTVLTGQGQQNNPGDEKEWTVLLYMNGNNTLSGNVITNLRQLEYVGSDDKMNFVAQASRAPGLVDKWSGDWTGTRRYEVKHNGKKLTPGVIVGDFLTSWMPGQTKKIESPVLQDMGDVDMGKADTLEEFLEWGIQNYPAKRYMVVMMGPSAGVSGMMHDQLNESKMTPAEVGQAFANATASTGEKIDVLTINGSATSSLEVASELKDSVKYLVGSQGIQAGGGMPLGQIFNELKSANEEEGQDALTMVRYWTLMNSMVGGGGASPLGNFSHTISAIDVDQIDGVKTAWDQLAQAMLAADISGEKLNDLLDKTQDFQGTSKNEAYQNNRDAIHFAKLVLADKSITDPAVRQKAQAAIDAIDGALVGDAASGKYVAEANGVSVFAPTHYGFFRPDGTDELQDFTRDGGYEKTNFAKSTQWDELLEKAGQDSLTNRALKGVGFSENTVDQIHGFTGQHAGKLTAPLSFASLAGWMNGINAWRGAEPSGFLFLNPQQAAIAGAVGAGWDALQAGQGMLHAATELKDSDVVVAKGLEVARAGAKGVANLGFLVPELKPYAGTAGMLMFLSPWLNNIYGIYSEYQNIREGIELGTHAQAPLIQNWGEATMRHFQNDNLWDQAS